MLNQTLVASVYYDGKQTLLEELVMENSTNYIIFSNIHLQDREMVNWRFTAS